MKTMFKRTLSTILAAMMLLSIGLIAGAETAETAEIVCTDYTDSGIKWTLDSEGHLMLSGEGPMFGKTPQRQPDVPWLIPYRLDIKKVTVGHGITDIGKYAFNSCNNLESVSIPVTVTTIKAFAFKNCLSLSDIELPSTITYIGECAFYNCTALSSIIIPQNVYTVGRFAFNKSGITSLGICSSKTALCERAFGECKNLETVTLSVSANSHKDAFYESNLVKTVNYTGTREEWLAFSFVMGSYHPIYWDDINFNSQGVRYIKEMYVSTPPEKMVYNVGEEPDFTGVVLTAEWSDGTIENVSDLSEIKAWDLNTSYSNNATVTFEYQLNTAKFHIPVVGKSTIEIIGSCGPYSRWILNIKHGGRMVIADKGELYEFDCTEKYPWSKWSSKIFSLNISENISYIGDNAFANYPSLYYVNIFEPKIAFGDNVFGNDNNFYEVRFYGTLDDWKSLEVGENNRKLYNADAHYFNDELHIHSYSETVIEEATCTETGSLFFECECGKTYAEEIPVTPHPEGTWGSDELGCIVKKCTACGTVVELTETTVNKNPQPAESEVNYGNSIVLNSGISGTLPEGAYIVWTASNENFDMEVSEDGKTCTVTSVESGETTFTATVYDANGNVIEETTQTITSNAGVMEQIADFFGKIFDFLFGFFK